MAFPKEERPLRLMEWKVKIWPVPVERSMSVFQKMSDDLSRMGDEYLFKMAWSFWLEKRLVHADFEKDFYRIAEDAIRFAKQQKWKDVEAETYLRIGRNLFQNARYGQGMEYMIKGKEEIAKTGWSSPHIAQLGYAGLGDSFYKFGDYATALEYLKKSEEYNLPLGSPAHEYANRNTIGLCYQKLQQYDSAIHYLTLSIEGAKMARDSFWVALTSGNLGLVYFKSGNLDKAAELLKSDYEGSIRAGVYGSAVNAGSLLANIELQRGNTDRIEEYIRFARMHMDTQNLEGMISYMSNMYTYSKLKGNFEKAVDYADSLKIFEERQDLILDQKILDQAMMKVQVDNHNAKVKLLEAAKSRQILIRNGLFVILLLSCMVGLLWVKRIQMKKQVAVEKLAGAQKELNAYALSLFEKNQLIQSVTEELEKTKTVDDAKFADRSANISELMHQHIFTDDDWRHFRQLFDQVYPGYLVRLKEKFNDLTPAETRLLALTKLQLPGKDMAGMLGISAESIRKTRYRLRKKLNLPEEGSLEELVSMI